MGINSYYYNDFYASQSYGSKCIHFFRALLIVIHILLITAAIGGLSIGIIEKEKMESTLKDICVSCSNVFITYIAGFSILFIFALLGFLALSTRYIFLRVLYGISLGIVFILAFILTLIYFLVSINKISLEWGWRETEAMCALELHYECSGWRNICHTNNTNNNNFNNNNFNNNNNNNICPVCSEKDQEKINQFNITCESLVLKDVKSHLHLFLPIGITIASLAFVGIIVTCMLQRKREMEKRYIGYYYRV